MGNGLSLGQDISKTSVSAGTLGNRPELRKQVILEVLHFLAVLGGTLLTAKILAGILDPYKDQKLEGKRRMQFLKRRFSLPDRMHLDEFEQSMAAHVLNPDEIDVTLEDISSWQDIIDDLEAKCFTPLGASGGSFTTLVRPPKGILLFGPPGTGKTMLAKALAHDRDFFFINVTVSSVMSKWLGDANRLIKALFTLAAKLSQLRPCVIFVDEVDALLSVRKLQDHDTVFSVKSEFMQMWEGITTHTSRVLVLGTTNRPKWVDPAVLRRFTLQYEMGLPNEDQRLQILQVYLRKHDKEMREALDRGGMPGGGAVPQSWVTQSQQTLISKSDSEMEELHDIGWVVANSKYFSGSDLVELCRQAASYAVNEFSRTGKLRPMSIDDFKQARQSVHTSNHAADEYERELQDTGGLLEGGFSTDTFAQQIQFWRAMMEVMGKSPNAREQRSGEGQNGSHNQQN